MQKEKFFMPYDEKQFIVVRADRIEVITGMLSCSYNGLFTLFCSMLSYEDNFCKDYSYNTIYKEQFTMDLREKQDTCNDCCIVHYQDEDIIVNQFYCGVICGKISSYVDGSSYNNFRECSYGDCKSNKKDRACCRIDQCVTDGRCHDVNTLKDVDMDGNQEICALVGEKAMWVDPDYSEQICNIAHYYWMDDKCCGDDKKEDPVNCKGEICGSYQSVCCPKNGCVFNGKCYPHGCTTLKINGEKKIKYCDTLNNQWVDLDTDEFYCKKCLDNRWINSMCCGDDIEEEKKIVTFEYYVDDSYKEGRQYCVNTLDKGCINPSTKEIIKEGYEEIHYDNKQNIFYCSKGKWQDPDTSKKLCENGGLRWINENCCGNDPNEFPILGKDGTVACCDIPSSCVENEMCVDCGRCGNNNIEDFEECEPPNEQNSPYCKQEQTCEGRKTVLYDKFGHCNDYCQCIEDNPILTCIKEQCNAECNEDGTGCYQGQICDTTTCICRQEEVEIIECEGNELCRISKGCDYKEAKYDLPEYCENGYCPEDLWVSDETYCQNCDNCGDGFLNCKEECDSLSPIATRVCCEDGMLYRETYNCINCNIQGFEPPMDEFVDDCFCDCPESPDSCVESNFIQYQEDYQGYCKDGQCETCNCEDTYTKDKDSDGIEDKCEVEVCDNDIDDNDDGLIDYDDRECIAKLCQQCGNGLFNFCDYSECRSLNEMCFFFESFLIGYCRICSEENCSVYGSNLFACEHDDCGIGNCTWSNKRCCTDVDTDGNCDVEDNCRLLYNPLQEDLDDDDVGDVCDIDDNDDGCRDGFSGYDDELIGLKWGEKKKICNNSCTFCNNGNCLIRDKDDNIELPPCMMCDGISEIGKAQNTDNGYMCNDSCTYCDQGQCNLRALCDDSECLPNTYCDGWKKKCNLSFSSRNVCEYCINDITPNDDGIKWLDGCCGDEPFEYYFNGSKECCSAITNCVSKDGDCISSNKLLNTTVLCWNHELHECNQTYVNRIVNNWQCLVEDDQERWVSIK